MSYLWFKLELWHNPGYYIIRNSLLEPNQWHIVDYVSEINLKYSD